MNKIQEQDIRIFSSSFPLSDDIDNCSFLITGATGLIGSVFIRCLMALNKNIEITCPVRNRAKAIDIFGCEGDSLHIVECDLVDYIDKLTKRFDYIIHFASPTSSKYMIEYPVETITFIVDSTESLLQYCKRSKVKGMVYISSLEYYGQFFDDSIIKEDMQGYIDMKSLRSSYPLGKRLAEYLCLSYFHEYNVNVKIARLTQTFGAGISKDDNRVFAQFARSIINKNDIVLHTEGDSAKPYCYTIDSVSAILYILLKGKSGEAYNVANPSTYISIKNMANMLCEDFSPQNKVIIELHPEKGYAPMTKLNLSVSKLLNLGWKPQFDLKDMFERLIISLIQ